MTDNPFRQVMRQIRRVIYHIGVFDGSLPRLHAEAPELTRAYLTVLQDCLPDLKHLVRYAADTVPVVSRMMGLADRGTTDLARASEMLRDVKRSTQSAVEEILAVLDRINPLLDRASRTERADEGSQQMIDEARGQLLLILNALQFQDITAQQIEATNALLADLGRGLGSLMEGLGARTDGIPHIDVAEGTFDRNASFDRDRAGASQQAIDQLLAGESEPAADDPGPAPGNGRNRRPPPVVSRELPEVAADEDTDGPVDGEEAVDQAAIDALLNGGQAG
jgi:chemotaxis regulatin CheY-phosphate phosphatase CheZ